MMAQLLKPKKSERDRDVEAKREKRSEAARIEIPECKNPARREACLQDPERFLRTYFADRYQLAFGAHHHQMIHTIHDRAKYGGRQAIAAPRGTGKSELVKGMLVYLVLAELVRFPLPVAATTGHAGRIYKDFRSKLMTNDLLLEDFPEVCFPVRALDGAPQRAGKQHVDGQLTKIVWTASDYLSLPYVPGSPYGGVKMAFYGLDSAFRGVNIDGVRPDFILIDDPETRESARMLGQIQDREDIIDQDIAGLAGQNENLAMVILTTVQNRYCLSYRFTDPKTKPAWNGVRFGLVKRWPDNMDMWQDYIAKRHAEQAAGDEHARAAVQLYLDNREEMDRGAEMLTDHFDPTTLEDGTQLVYSSLQQAFNKIADTSMGAFRTEYQNDPEPEEEIETNGLTAAKVQARLAKEMQRETPKTTELITYGIDIGKHASHWTKIAWENPAIGTVVDYGVMETHGLNIGSDNKAVELALMQALEVFAEDIVKDDPPLVLIDSGTYTGAVYEACRRLGRPFFPAKGWDSRRFRMPKKSAEKLPFLECYASLLAENRIWLYNVNTEWWKLWLQERFLIHPYDESGHRSAGSLAIYNPGGDRKRHLSFAHHIVAEERRMVPVFGKELRPQWFVKSRNNHWLDSTALACTAAGIMGIRLVETQPTVQPAPVKRNTAPSRFVTPHGRPFVATQR